MTRIEELELHLRLANAKIRSLEREVNTWKEAFQNQFGKAN